MRRYLPVVLASSIVLTACAGTPRRVQFSGGYPLHDCPQELDDQVKLQVEARPIELQASRVRANSIATTGSVGRRVAISVIPAGLRTDDRIVWSTLSVASYGGTFLGWDTLQTNAGVTSPWSNSPELTPQRRSERTEIASVALAPGQLKIARTARGRTDLAGMYSIDVLLMPGGVAVDDTVVHIPTLWDQNGAPLPAAAISPQLVPIRHPPGLDVVEATFELDFVVRRGTGDEWSCSAQTRATLVDQDALRQPFWDLGLASSNSARREWLALFDPALGGVRLVFDSPARANALVDWLRATRSSRLGPYAVGAFQQTSRHPRRPFASISEDRLQTFRPLADRDIDSIVVRPVAEP